MPLPELAWDERADGAAPELDGALRSWSGCAASATAWRPTSRGCRRRPTRRTASCARSARRTRQTRSELTSLHQKEKNRVAELEARIAAGPDGATLARLAATETRGRRARRGGRGRAQRGALHGARGRGARPRAGARARGGRGRGARGARGDRAGARGGRAGARRARPREDDLLRAASHVGASAAARLRRAGGRRPAAAGGRRGHRPLGRRAPARRPPPRRAPPPAVDGTARGAGVRRRRGGDPELRPAGAGGARGRGPAGARHRARRRRPGRLGVPRRARRPAHRARLRRRLPRAPPAAARAPSTRSSSRHAHADHMGGVPDLLRAQPGCRVYCSKPTKLLMLDQANAVGKFIPGDRVLVRDPGETYRILDGADRADAEPRGPLPRLLRGAPALRRRPDASSTPATSAARACARCARRRRCRSAARTRCCWSRRSATAPRSRGNYAERLLREVAAVVGERRLRGLPRVERRPGPGARRAARRAAWRTGSIPVLPVRMSPLARKMLDRYRRATATAGSATSPTRTSIDIGADAEPEEIVSEAGYVIASGASGLHGPRARCSCWPRRRSKNCGVFFTGLLRPERAPADARRPLEVVEDDGRVISTTIASRWQWIPSPDHPNGEELAAAVAGARPRRADAARARQRGRRSAASPTACAARAIATCARCGDGDRVTIARD